MEHSHLISELNPAQQAAATAAAGPIMIVAGAGTGKTRTLTCRLAHLVENGVDPANILLMTFTNRAASEMLERAAQLVKTSINDLIGGTFHHVAHVFLRRYGSIIGIDRNFSIIDKEDAKALMNACVRELEFNKTRGFPNKGTLIAISGLHQNTMNPLPQVVEKNFPACDEYLEQIENTLELYAVKKRDGNLLDFDDLLEKFHALLSSHSDVREKLSERFMHILVDEYQDTNALQCAIVDLLASHHRNLCVVGDDAQSIYSFRGAEISNILSFQQRYPDARVYRLEENYRSTSAILALANENIGKNTSRLPKKLFSSREAAEAPVLVSLANGNAQARFVADRIEHMLVNGCSLADIAILYRSHYHSLEIQLELQNRGIPFIMRGGLRFFEQAHVKDVLAFLRIKNNPVEQPAWLRVLLMLPGFGPRTAEKFWRRLNSEQAPLSFAYSPAALDFIPAKVRSIFAEFAKTLEQLDNAENASDIVRATLDGFYRDYMRSNYTMPERRENDINAVAEYTTQYSNIGDFLAHITLTNDLKNDETGATTYSDSSNAVLLSTIHQAKGLEWTSVFVPWLNEGRFPACYNGGDLDEIEEERRIFHVAVTRAKDRLFLCTPQMHKDKKGEVKKLLPSRFVTELNQEFLCPYEKHGQIKRAGAHCREPSYDYDDL